LAGCVCTVPQGAQLTAAGWRAAVVALRIPVLLDCGGTSLLHHWMYVGR
jgi:hypothetical protein